MERDKNKGMKNTNFRYFRYFPMEKAKVSKRSTTYYEEITFMESVTTTLKHPTTWRHGILSQQPVLPWERQTDYDELNNTLISEYKPVTPTQHHLVLELVNIMWRKQRLVHAQQANIHKAFHRHIQSKTQLNDLLQCVVSNDVNTTSPDTYGINDWDIRKVMRYTPCEVKDTLTKLKEEYNQLEQQLHQTGDTQEDYQLLISTLDTINQTQWNDHLEDDSDNSISSLKRFITEDVLPDINKHITLLKLHPLMLKQAIGDAYLTTQKDQTPARYEAQLDHKFEKHLAILLKLQDMNSKNVSIEESIKK